MPRARTEFSAGLRASRPLLIVVAPFGLVTGVAMAAGGIPPLEAMAVSVLVYAGTSMLAAAQLIAEGAPELLPQKGVLSIALGNERLLAGIVPIAIAWRFRVTFGTIIAGLAALQLFDWMF